MLTPVPLLIIPLALFNMVAFLTPSLDWGEPILAYALPSGATWKITLAEAFLALSLVFLLLEIIKSTRVAARAMMDHLLAALLFAVSLAEFLLVPQAGNSVFALLLCIMLLDVCSGIFMSMRVVRHQQKSQPDAG